MPQTHYDILGVDRNATCEDIRKKYLEQIRKIHPDKNPNESDQERVKALNAAWDVLKDNELRQAYDEGLRNTPQGNLDPKEITIAKLTEQIALLHNTDCQLIKDLFPVNTKMDPFFQEFIFGLERSCFLIEIRNLSVKMLREINGFGMLTFINETAEMLSALLRSPADTKLYEKILLEYAEKFISEHQQHPTVNACADEINKILNSTIKVNLYQVHSSLLEQEADRIKNIFAGETDKKKKCEQFARTLKNVASYANDVATDLNEKNVNINEIINSEALLFAKDTLNTVKALEFLPEKRLEDKNRLIHYGNTYQQNAKQPGRFRNFLKAAGTVVTMGIDAILVGTLLAIPCAFVSLLWGGLIGACIGGGGGALIGFVSGLGIGYEHGKSWTKFNGYSISRALVFMPQDLRPELSQKVDEKGRELLCPKVSKSWFGCFSRKHTPERMPLSNNQSLILRPN